MAGRNDDPAYEGEGEPKGKSLPRPVPYDHPIPFKDPGTAPSVTEILAEYEEQYYAEKDAEQE